MRNSSQPWVICHLEDQRFIHEFARLIFAQSDKFHYAYQFEEGKKLLDAFPLDPMPHVLLLDLGLPDMEGDEVLRILRKQGIDIPVIVFSGAIALKSLVKPYMQLNVKAFLDKNCPSSMLLAAVEDVLNDRLHINKILEEGLRMPDEAAKPESELAKRWRTLTERQKLYAILCARYASETLQQIADRMDVELSTVHTYGRDVRAALGVANRPELVKVVTELGETEESSQ
jgi:DNA-binding NarL/FixJ family response regulator